MLAPRNRGPRPPRRPVRAEERLRSLVAHVADAVIGMDEHGTILSFNTAAERVFGYAAPQVIGRNLALLISRPVQRQQEGPAGTRLAVPEVGVTSPDDELAGRRRDGTLFPIELAIGEARSGLQRQFTAVVRDITERRRAEDALREAEARMRSVVDHVVDAIITIDAEALIQSFNPAAQKLFGYRPEEVLGRNVNLLMPAPDREHHDASVRNYLATGQARIIGIGREVVGCRKDGSSFPMELAVSEFQIGSRRFFTGILRDITERKRAEQALRESQQLLLSTNELLRRADRQKDEFLATLAHELRNPLAAIRNSVELMRPQDPADPAIEHARLVIERQVSHLTRLVDDLLDVSRLTRGAIQLQEETLDLGAVALAAADSIEPAVRAAGLTLRKQIEGAPIPVRGDPTRLAQCVLNVLNNAVKFTPAGGHVLLRVQREDATAVLEVRDSGIGIPAGSLERIFELFAQEQLSGRGGNSGLGIGLALTRRLVELHGGRIVAASAGPGQGSSFRLELPMTAATRPDPPVEPQRAAGAGAVILVVDDNRDAAETLSEVLAMSGFRSFVVYDGETALREMERQSPDAVLLDIGLPDIDGYEVCRRIRHAVLRTQPVVIAVTGWGQHRDREQAAAAGFNAHLTKPAHPERVMALLNELLSTSR